MPKCPNCLEEIDYVNAFCYETNKYEVRLDEKYDGLDWGTSEVMEGSASKTEFNCPECDHTIFTIPGEVSNPQSVIDFLKGLYPTRELR